MSEVATALATELERQNEELLTAMMGDAQGAVALGMPPKFRELVHRGDEDLPTPMIEKVYQDAGVVAIYDTQTAERSFTNRNMLSAQMKKKREDGSFVFTTRKPPFEPIRGILRCLLHPEHPQRQEFDRIGFATCKKANLTSEFMVEQHMRHRHKIEWETIEKQRKERKESEERAYQHALTDAVAKILQAQTSGEPEPVGAGNGRKKTN